MRLLLIVCFTFVLASTPAFAGKQERDYKSNKLEPAVKEMQVKYKEGCGCDINVTINPDAFKTETSMEQIRYTMTEVSDKVVDYCNDKGTKDVMCKMTSIDYTLADNSDVEKFENGILYLKTDGRSYVSFDMITGAVDK